MGNLIERPIFDDGAVLEAADLNSTIDLARDRDARHSRQSHRWGIVTGLELVGTNGQAGLELSVKPGVARDSRGREIIVSQEQPISPDSVSISPAPTDWAPVFLIGLDADVDGTTTLGECTTAGANRKREDFSIVFGMPQDANGWEDAQPQPEIDEGPDNPMGQEAPRVLLGFVQYDGTNFTAVKDFAPDGTRRRNAGVRGGVFESTDGHVVTRFGEPDADALSISVDGAPPILTVDRKGNLTIQGTLQSAIKGDVKVSSGIATDGTQLPLPAGVDETDAGTKVTVHVFLRPVVDLGVIALPIECTVDTARRVRCQIVEWSGGAFSAPKAGRVDFILIAASKGA